MTRIRVFACCALIMTAVPAFARSSAVDAVSAVLSRPTPIARKAEIGRQVARMCNMSLSDDQLAKASAFVESHRGKGAVWVADQIRQSELSYVCNI
ncbi:hypothetical protein [Methylocystis parvus]|uniref:DUF732 domain-containing protein n=1 Tax=Methylocystis parvus TaxID=134 RepID=A0A6B8M8A3_9HYPH|nr:hypothetical protein [Methylocystis parvus]QGM97859.1 hypothetical protein F7D14_10525 [Methylocystis parvus]WBK01833.1 hypothetical protein MMG94_09060 [Methylocystis parvus OBBP]